MTAEAALALAIGRFRDCEPGDLIAAVAIEGGGTARLTYGDLRELAISLGEAQERLGRISDWHSRETGAAGMVGDYCVECGLHWPCDTRKLADGTYVDDEDSEEQA